MIHPTPPPGYIAAPWESLGMSRQNWYQASLDDVIDSWQVAPNTPRLYAGEDVGKLRYWLFVRRGLIALGLLPGNTPLRPDFDLLAWFEEDYHGGQCPRCGSQAVDAQDGRVWCEKCGVVEI
jgi:hypothetical protein